MRKLIYICFIFICIIFINSCSSENKKYKLEVNDEYGILNIEEKEEYSYNEKIRVTMGVKPYEVDCFELLLNDEKLEHISIISDSVVPVDKYFYEYEFKMPDKNSTLVVKKVKESNICQNEHIFDNGVIIKEGTSAYEILFTCTVCGYEEIKIGTVIPPIKCDEVGHTWNEGEYKLFPFDGCEPSFVYTCTECGALTVRLSNDLTPREIKYTARANELLEPISGKFYPGMIITLKARILIDADIAVIVNGKEIHKDKTSLDEDYWTYVFVMPDEDVTISCLTTVATPPEYSFNLFEAYTNEMFSVDDIELVKHKHYSSYDKEGELAEITYSNNLNDFIKIVNLFNTYFDKEVQIGMYAMFDNIDEFSVYLKDGTKYVVNIYDNIFYYQHKYYQIFTIPSFECTTMKCFSFITNENKYEGIIKGVYDELKQIVIKNLNEVEFVEQNEPLFDIDNVILIIHTSFGEITVRSDLNFYLTVEGERIKTYKIVTYSKDAPLGFYGYSNT